MSRNDRNAPAVYVQTNDAAGNSVIAFERRAGGGLATLEHVATGGRGTGMAHFPSQGSVVLGDRDRRLLVVNAGSDELSLFEVDGGGLQLTDRVATGGATPTSVTVHDDLVYVLNNGTANINGFRIEGGQLVALQDAVRPLSAENADGAQISFSDDGRTLIVTERGTDAISTYTVDAEGYASDPTTIPSLGRTPYGFDFAARGAIVVTEAFGGEAGAAAASSYALTEPGVLAPISGSVADTRSEVCWAAVTSDGRFAYVTNFGDGTISSYAIGDDGSLVLCDPVAGSTRLGHKGIRDEAITGDGRYLYAIDTDAQRVFGWALGDAGELVAIGAFEGVPDTVAGLAAS